MNRLLLFALLLLWSSAGWCAETSTASKAVTVSLDADLVTFVKAAIWVGGAFLAAFAFIGVAFFGWDVHKARSSISEVQKEIKQQLEELRKDFAELKELKEKLEQLGAQLEEATEPTKTSANRAQVVERSNLDLIREVISTSSYEWTTIGRIMKRTGLSREEILREVRAAPDIQIGHGRKTQDNIFKFKNAS